jgi:T5orf172 domain.
MGITDVFKTKHFKNDIERLTAENNYLNSLLTPEMKAAVSINSEIQRLNAEKESIRTEIEGLKGQRQRIGQEIWSLNNEVEQKKSLIIHLDDEILYQDFGLYTPVYNLMNSEMYKDKLAVVRERQKTMVKNNTAATFPSNFTYNNSLAQGKKLVADNVKQLLRAFNNECEAIIDKVKFNNVESIRKRIIKSCEDLNKLNSKMQISITPTYLDLKLQEMNLCYEYAVKKQEEKEEQKRIRAEQRETQKLQKEIEEARRKSEKEKIHYKNALHRIEIQMQSANEIERAILEERQLEMQHQLNNIEEEIRKIDYREANQRAGYVYIISNIGSFGENIYKIGMTRRLEPMDRVDELGDASVPFAFDVHAMIFSDDAPSLESALHRAFDDRKVNMINTRREFFHVTLEEIEEVVKRNFDKTVEFTKIPNAEQFRESQMIRRQAGLEDLVRHEASVDIPTAASSSSRVTSIPSLKDITLDPSKEYLKTKWGIYEMPNPYHIHLARGPYDDLKLVATI